MDKQENIFEGKTAEEAVESGLAALGLKERTSKWKSSIRARKSSSAMCRRR